MLEFKTNNLLPSSTQENLKKVIGSNLTFINAQGGTFFTDPVLIFQGEGQVQINTIRWTITGEIANSISLSLTPTGRDSISGHQNGFIVEVSESSISPKPKVKNSDFPVLISGNHQEVIKEIILLGEDSNYEITDRDEISLWYKEPLPEKVLIRRQIFPYLVIELESDQRLVFFSGGENNYSIHLKTNNPLSRLLQEYSTMGELNKKIVISA